MKDEWWKTLNKKDEGILSDTGNETDPVKIAVKKYVKHPSILRIKKLIREFYFTPIDKDQKKFKTMT